MDKVSFQEKHNWYNKMNQMIWSNKTIDAKTKAKIDKEIKDIFGKVITKQELEQLEKKIAMEMSNTKKETVQQVVENLNDPKKISGVSSINSINTINRNGGQVITSFQKSDGSIHVKDSSYSGNINEVVNEVSAQAETKNMGKNELTEKAFEEMQKRQIVVPMQDINSAGLTNNQYSTIRQIPNMGDNIKINSEYKIAVDEKNTLVDLQDSTSKVESYENEDSYVNEKPKVLTLSRNNNRNRGDAAFVDAALVGMVTLYAGLLGLCAIFGKM